MTRNDDSAVGNRQELVPASAQLLVGPGLRDHPLLRPSNVSQLIGISVQTLARHRKTRNGPPFLKDGRYYYYRPRDVLDWCSSRGSGRVKLERA